MNEKKKKKTIPIIFTVIILIGISNLFSNDEPENDNEPTTEIVSEPVESESVKEEVESKEPELTIEEQSKHWVQDTLANNDLRGTLDKYFALEDEDLKKKIALGNARGTQWSDDFDIIGEEVTATGIVGKRMEPSGGTKYYVYLGDMDISAYDSYNTFIEENPEERGYEVLVTFDGFDNILDWEEGQEVTFKGKIAMFPYLEEEFSRIDYTRPVE